LQALGVSEEIFRRRKGRSETNARPRAVGPKVDNPGAGKRPLNPRQKNRARGELLAIGSANPSRRGKYYRLISEVSEPRGTIGLAERIEDDRMAIIV